MWKIFSIIHILYIISSLALAQFCEIKIFWSNISFIFNLQYSIIHEYCNCIRRVNLFLSANTKRINNFDYWKPIHASTQLPGAYGGLIYISSWISVRKRYNPHWISNGALTSAFWKIFERSPVYIYILTPARASIHLRESSRVRFCHRGGVAGPFFARILLPGTACSTFLQRTLVKSRRKSANVHRHARTATCIYGPRDSLSCE